MFSSKLYYTLFFLTLVLSLASCDTLRKAPATSSAARSHRAGSSYSKTHSKATPVKKPTSTYSKPVKPNSIEINNVIEQARNYLGTPYRSGGNDKKGIDCSGLICSVYSEIGMKVPRISWQQSEYGKEVTSINDIQTGDWLFFVPEAGKEGYVSHAGIVTEVRSNSEIMFIHASSSRGVREDNLFSTYFKGRFVKAMRPF
tara:strand:+ start:23 stop:622 length:600 start_codon:yes stop_codon:yes gene_type:complete